MPESSVLKLLRSRKTVFDTNDLVLLWGTNNQDYLKTKIYRLVKSGQLIRLRGGIYALDINYDRIELANKLIVPSYVSFETVLAREGITFQYDRQIYSASRINKTIEIKGELFVFRKIKDEALLNTLGIEIEGNKMVASKERAVVDVLYLFKDFYFDSLSGINWDRCFEIVSIYKNKSLERRLKKLKNDCTDEKKMTLEDINTELTEYTEEILSKSKQFNSKQKVWVKTKLLPELIFLVNVYAKNLK